MNTVIKNTIESTNEEAQYDEYAKKIVGNKYILARILKEAVDEFKGMKLIDVYYRIEGEPIINKVPVEPGLTNKKAGENIIGLNTEDSEPNEGLARYDILFYVRMDDGLAQIIVNVEIQKDEPSGYRIINRAVFYTSRLISSQKNRDFVNQNYDDIKRVFSIWLCFNLTENCMNYIHLTNDCITGTYDWKGRMDLINIVLIGMGKEIPSAEKNEYSLQRFLGMLFSDTLSASDKEKIMETEYNIPMKQDLKEDLDNMCNLSQGISERAEARGVAIGEANGEARGIIQTALKYGIPETEIIKNLQETLHVTLQQAQEYFGKYGKNTV